VIQLSFNPASQIRSEEKNVCVQTRALCGGVEGTAMNKPQGCRAPRICKRAAWTLACAVNVDQDLKEAVESWWSDTLR